MQADSSILNPEGGTMTYEATVRVYAPNGLNDEQQRVWGDAMSDAEDAIAQALVDAGASFQIETHGPEARIAA